MSNSSGSWRYRRERRAPRPAYVPPPAPPAPPAPGELHGPRSEEDQWWLDLPIEEWAELLAPAMGRRERPWDPSGPTTDPTWPGAYDGQPAMRAELRILLDLPSPDWPLWEDCSDAAWCVLGRGETYADHAARVERSPERIRQRVATALRVCQHRVGG